MHLQESGEMYLETIYVLSKKGKGVRAVDVGEYMGFSKPSVSRAMGILRSGGFVELDKDGYLVLTEEGLRVAGRTYARHELFTAFFEAIGVSPEVAEADACKIEHDISDETFEAMKRFTEKMKAEA